MKQFKPLNYFKINKRKIRAGRGPSGRRGKTCGKGYNGQNSRSGRGVKLGYEGGQFPKYRSIKKNKTFFQYRRKNVLVLHSDSLSEWLVTTNSLQVSVGMLLNDNLIDNVKSKHNSSNVNGNNLYVKVLYRRKKIDVKNIKFNHNITFSKNAIL